VVSGSESGCEEFVSEWECTQHLVVAAGSISEWCQEHVFCPILLLAAGM
jgi:hypothetical protein